MEEKKNVNNTSNNFMQRITVSRVWKREIRQWSQQTSSLPWCWFSSVSSFIELCGWNTYFVSFAWLCLQFCFFAWVTTKREENIYVSEGNAASDIFWMKMLFMISPIQTRLNNRRTNDPIQQWIEEQRVWWYLMS